MEDSRYKALLEGLYCTEKTKVHIYDSREQTNEGGWVDNAELLVRLQDVASVVGGDPPSNQQNTPTLPPLVVISTTGVGDLDGNKTPLNISQSSLGTLIDSCQLPRQMVHMLGTRLPHVSYHLDYEPGTEKLNAISVMARLPRNSIHITVILRVRLQDNACFCLLVTKSNDALEDLTKLFIKRQNDISKYPFLILSLIIDYRLAWYDEWLDRMWVRVDDLEESTGMTAWPRTGMMGMFGGGIWDDSFPDYDRILKELHAVNVELIVAETTMKFGRTFMDFCQEMLVVFGDGRKQCGISASSSSDRQRIEGGIAFTGRLIQFRHDKFRELLDRVRSQINVTFSLVTQKDSQITARLAESAARDSQTMKTITVITLVFLPSTLLATIWSSGIFKLDQQTNWKVFVGTSVGLTVFVFVLWILYRTTFLPWRTHKRSKARSKVGVVPLYL